MNSGKKGERLFQQKMEQQGYEVINVSNNPDYYYKDIDFIITSPTSGETKTFEVKFDDKINQTGNLYLELENIHSKCGLGWFEFCKADYIAYGDSKTETFYVISLLDLKKRANEVPRRIARCGNDSYGQLVSLDDIQDLVKVVR